MYQKRSDLEIDEGVLMLRQAQVWLTVLDRPRLICLQSCHVMHFVSCSSSFPFKLLVASFISYFQYTYPTQGSEVITVTREPQQIEIELL